MGPKKYYLLLRRMHLARASLFAADPAETTVTDIATMYGFWQLGRFSVDTSSCSVSRLPLRCTGNLYRALFSYGGSWGLRCGCNRAGSANDTQHLVGVIDEADLQRGGFADARAARIHGDEARPSDQVAQVAEPLPDLIFRRRTRHQLARWSVLGARRASGMRQSVHQGYGSVATVRRGIGAWLSFYNDEWPHPALDPGTPRDVFVSAFVSAYLASVTTSHTGITATNGLSHDAMDVVVVYDVIGSPFGTGYRNRRKSLGIPSKGGDHLRHRRTTFRGSTPYHRNKNKVMPIQLIWGLPFGLLHIAGSIGVTVTQTADQP